MFTCLKNLNFIYVYLKIVKKNIEENIEPMVNIRNKWLEIGFRLIISCKSKFISITWK